MALGAGSVATQDYTVSVGSADVKRRIVNVAAGTAATDAATYGQLTGGSVAASFSTLGVTGLATFNGGATVSNGFTVSSGGINVSNGGITNVGAVSGVTSLSASGAATVGSLDAGSGVIKTTGALSGGTLTTTGDATVGGVLSAQGANFNDKVITGVAAGTAGTHAVNKNQLDAVNATATAAQSAASAADGKFTSGAVDAKFKSLDAGSGTIQTTGTISGDTLTTTGNATVGGALSAQGADFNNKVVTGVAAGVNATDAVNKGQLDAAIAGVSAAAGDATAALAAADAAQATANTALSAAGTAQATADNALSAAGTAQATADTALNAAANSAQYADGGQTLGLNDNGGAGTRVANVAAGAVAMDAVNFGQLQAVMTQLMESGLCRVTGTSVSCGAAAAADAVQLGSGATVADGADNAVAIGHNASAQSAGGVAVGDGATAVMANSVAIGKGATAHSSVAVGTGAQALGANTTALGDDAVASGEYAVALGNNAQATHDNAVALGNGSVTSAADTVSVGAPGAARRITHAAAPVEAGDVATKGYVDALEGRAGAYTDRQVSAARDYAARGIAATAAIVSVMPSAVGKTAIGIGTGHYDGHNALGLSIAHAPRANVLLSAGVAASNGGSAVLRTGVAFEF